MSYKGYMVTRLYWAALSLVLLGLCGCSTFNRNWRRADVPPPAENSVEGPWQGTWHSEATGHNGALRCLMLREGDSHFQARFRATYGGIFHYSYTAELELHPHDTGWEFDGEANLGKLAGGEYFYEGRATATNLVSTYRSKHDHGLFEMKRP
jgi:hypothetical protein